MGTWGTAIKDNDAFADIYGEFFELYNKGGQPDSISKQITESNWEILEIEEEKHSFWFALALAQWETKSLDPKVLETVETIIKTEADIKIWSDLGATEKDIDKRKVALNKFLDKLYSDNPKEKKTRFGLSRECLQGKKFDFCFRCFDSFLYFDSEKRKKKAKIPTEKLKTFS